MIIDKSKCSERAAGLDLFRVLSVFMVFIFHTHIHHHCSYGPLNGFVSMGAIFMTAFFMLSGFVLYRTYNRQNLVDIRQLRSFYLKRIIGIIPLYYVSALIYVLCFGKESITQNLLLAPIDMLGLQSTFSSLFEVSHHDRTWFISCLLLAYAAFPFMQEVIKQMSTKAKVAAIFVCAFALLWAPLIVHSFSTDSIYASPFYRGLEFFIGALLCSLPQMTKFLYSFKAFLVEAVGLIVVVSVAVHQGLSVGNYMLYNWVALPAFALMIMTLSGLHTPRLQNSSILRYASAVSYAFFMAQTFNTNIESYLFRTCDIENNLAKIAISVAVCSSIAIVMHELFEKKATRFLKKKFKSYI
jgi:peptidoglycan/LPS O-acetylase OafA/YrhL